MAKRGIMTGRRLRAGRPSRGNGIFTLKVFPPGAKSVKHVSISTPQILFIVCLIALIVAFSIAVLVNPDKSVALKAKTVELQNATASLESVADQLNSLLSTGDQLEKSIKSTQDALYDNAGSQLASAAAPHITLDRNTNLSSQYAGMENGVTGLSNELKAAADVLQQISPILQLHKQILADLPTRWPLIAGRGTITQLYGPNINPFTGYYYMHKGLDISDGTVGTPIVSMGNGVVAETGYDQFGYGNYVWVDHKYGFRTRYNHMSKILVHAGQTVKVGQVLGLEGATGLVTGPHVHLELYLGDELLNPLAFIIRQ